MSLLSKIFSDQKTEMEKQFDRDPWWIVLRDLLGANYMDCTMFATIADVGYPFFLDNALLVRPSSSDYTLSRSRIATHIKVFGERILIYIVYYLVTKRETILIFSRSDELGFFGEIGFDKWSVDEAIRIRDIVYKLGLKKESGSLDEEIFNNTPFAPLSLEVDAKFLSRIEAYQSEKISSFLNEVYNVRQLELHRYLEKFDFLSESEVRTIIGEVHVHNNNVLASLNLSPQVKLNDDQINDIVEDILDKLVKGCPNCKIKLPFLALHCGSCKHKYDMGKYQVDIMNMKVDLYNMIAETN
jgi:hypothetical protein